MGKSNRIRNDRANTTLSGVKPRKKNDGMPGWAINLIAIAVAVIIFASVAVSLMSANGIFSRMKTAVKSDNYRVDANMMNYYFTTQYNSFVSENSSYLSYYGLDTSLSLKDQYINGSDDSDGTWFDYMMKQTTSQVEEILVYCEEANARGIELDDTDIASIDTELQMYKTYAQIYGYTTNSYIATIYGKGMKEKDIRNALELSALASKCSEEVGDEIKGLITDTDIDSEYSANTKDYNLVDYSSYTFTVKYEDVIAEVLGKDDYTDEEAEEKEEEIIAAYKAKIEETREKANALMQASDSREAFENIVISYIVADIFDANYDDAIEDGDVVEADLPNEAQTEEIRLAIITYISDKIINGEKFEESGVVADGKVVGTDIEVTESYAEVIKDMAHDVYDTSEQKLEATFSEGKNYSDTDDALEWAFEDGRKAGDTKAFEDGDGADGAELATSADELKSFTVSAYLLTKAQYRDETFTKNIGIMVFSSEDTAASAIEKLYEGIGLEAFEDICDELGGSFTDYENYTEGSMGVDDFDSWLYADGTKVGSYTVEAIALDDSQYAVVIYYADGDEAWYVSVKSAIYTERYEAFDAEIKEKYTVETNDKTIAKIDG